MPKGEKNESKGRQPGEQTAGDEVAGDASGKRSATQVASTAAAKAADKAKAGGSAKNGKTKGNSANGRKVGPKPAGAKAAKPGGLKPAARRPQRPAPTAEAEMAAWRAADVVVGRVSIGSRIAGVLGIVAALGLAVRPFLPLGTVHGRVAGINAGALGLLGWLPAVVVVGGAGVLALTGRLTRLGLGVIGAAGALSIGLMLRSAWLLEGGRSTLDLPVGGQALHGDAYAIGSGLVVAVVTGSLLVLALLAVLLGWTGSVMDDGGGFDRRRPLFGALGLFAGVVTAGAFAMSASSSSIGIAPQAVTAQVGLQRVAGLLLAVAIVCCCVLAPTLRPWLAGVGGLLGVTVMLGGEAVENVIAVYRSPDLHANLGTISQLVVPVFVLALAAAAALVRAPVRELAA